ncbi:MAG: glycine cleavage system protein R [Nitrospinaceae bacterium]
MDNWYMLTLVGKDQPGIVANLTTALCKGGCNLGESSMARLGNNFTIMLMAQFDGTLEDLEKIVAPAASSMSLHQHVIPVEGGNHHLIQPNVRISVYCSDRPGIMEDVTCALAEAGLNILTLDSNIGSPGENPAYYIHIEGVVGKGIDPLYEALDILSTEKNMQTQLIPIDTLLT